MLGSPFRIERCSLTVRNKRKARQDGFRPFIPRVLGAKKLGRIRPRGHTLAKPSGFSSREQSWPLRRLRVNKLEQKTWRSKPDGDLLDCGLRGPCTLQQRRLRHFFKNAFSILSLRMHLLASCKRAVLGPRVRLACEFVPLQELRVARQARAGWRTGNVTENPFDILINCWYTI